MTLHTVAITCGNGRAFAFSDVNAIDPVHAVIQVFAQLSVEHHPHVLRVNVSANAR